MERIRCAFFFHDTDYFSGGSRSLLDIIDTYIAQDNIAVVAVFPSDKGSAIEYLRKKNIDIVCSHYYQIRYELSESKIEYIKKLPMRILRLFGSKIWVMLKTIPELKEKNIDIIYSNTSFILSGYWSSKSLQVPLIAHFREFGEEDHKIGVWIGRNSFYRIANQYDRIICISNSLKEKYQKRISEDKIRVIYDDVSKEYVNWSEEEIKPEIDKNFNILLAGNLTPGKGQKTVLSCLANYIQNNKKITVYIAGNPSDSVYVNEIKELIDEHHIKGQIKFLGLVKDMNTLRKKMHVGIVLSDMEAFGRVTIEGMLSGMIMIAARTGGSVELIEDRVNGFLVEKDGKELESIISYIHDNYGSLRTMQKQAFNFAKEFTESKCSKTVLENIEELIEK